MPGWALVIMIIMMCGNLNFAAAATAGHAPRRHRARSARCAKISEFGLPDPGHVHSAGESRQSSSTMPLSDSATENYGKVRSDDPGQARALRAG